MDDVDLIVGLLLEKTSDGAVVGPTTRCLIADGFYRYKAGDRFFYDVQGQPGSFTPGKFNLHNLKKMSMVDTNKSYLRCLCVVRFLEQLKVIKKITLGHVICTISNVDHVQKDIFKLVDHK